MEEFIENSGRQSSWEGATWKIKMWADIDHWEICSRMGGWWIVCEYSGGVYNATIRIQRHPASCLLELSQSSLHVPFV